MLDAFQFAFMQNALLMGILISVPCALLSCYIVLRGWSLIGDAVSHAVLPGLVLAQFFGVPLLIGAFVAGLTCAGVVNFISVRSRVKDDALLGIIFCGFFALGVVLQSKLTTDLHLDHILFGNLLGISQEQLLMAAAVCLFVLCFLFVQARDLLLFCFDSYHAEAVGLSTRWLHLSLVSVLILTIVAALNAVGIVLVVALLIAPGATVFLITQNFYKMMFLSVLFVVFCTVTGVTLSFYIDSAPAPTIVLLMTIGFISSFCLFLFKKRLNKPKVTRVKARLITSQEEAESGV